MLMLQAEAEAVTLTEMQRLTPIPAVAVALPVRRQHLPVARAQDAGAHLLLAGARSLVLRA